MCNNSEFLEELVSLEPASIYQPDTIFSGNVLEHNGEKSLETGINKRRFATKSYSKQQMDRTDISMSAKCQNKESNKA